MSNPPWLLPLTLILSLLANNVGLVGGIFPFPQCKRSVRAGFFNQSEPHWFIAKAASINLTCTQVLTNANASEQHLRIYNSLIPLGTVAVHINSSSTQHFEVNRSSDWFIYFYTSTPHTLAQVAYNVETSNGAVQGCELDCGAGYCNTTGKEDPNSGVCVCPSDPIHGYWNLTGRTPCTQCIKGYFGPQCNTNVTCDHGTCLESKSGGGQGCWGVNGTGTCNSCEERYYGENCDSHSNCSRTYGQCTSQPSNGRQCSGINGTGVCSECQYNETKDNKLFRPMGQYCDKNVACNLVEGRCAPATKVSGNWSTCWGVQGTGACSFCKKNSKKFWGPYCNWPVLCKDGTCDDGTCGGSHGTGICRQCNRYKVGPTCKHDALCVINNSMICEERTCWGANRNLDQGCQQCLPGKFWGKYCNNTVNCEIKKGNCPSTCWGVDGNGECRGCKNWFYGPTCAHAAGCNASGGGACKERPRGNCYGMNGTGKCDSCYALHYGENCQPVKCKWSNGLCSRGYCSGINATGLCVSCNQMYFGATCENVTCNLHQGLCEQGTCWGRNASGFCTKCIDPSCRGRNCDVCAPTTPGWFLILVASLSTILVFTLVHLLLLALSLRQGRSNPSIQMARKQPGGLPSEAVGPYGYQDLDEGLGGMSLPLRPEHPPEGHYF